MGHGWRIGADGMNGNNNFCAACSKDRSWLRDRRESRVVRKSVALCQRKETGAVGKARQRNRQGVWRHEFVQNKAGSANGRRVFL